jgi:hypothetical protein
VLLPFDLEFIEARPPRILALINIITYKVDVADG